MKNVAENFPTLGTLAENKLHIAIQLSSSETLKNIQIVDNVCLTLAACTASAYHTQDQQHDVMSATTAMQVKACLILISSLIGQNVIFQFDSGNEPMPDIVHL